MLASPMPVYQYYIFFFFSNDISICFSSYAQFIQSQRTSEQPLGNKRQLYTVLYEEKLF